MTRFTVTGEPIVGIDLTDHLTAQFLDGRSFDDVITPGTWIHQNLVDAVRPTIERLVRMYEMTEDREAKVRAFPDIDLGMIFVSLFHDVQEEQTSPVAHYLITNRRPEHFGMPHPYHAGEDFILDRAAVAIGAWLKSNLPVSRGNTNPESETTMTVTTEQRTLVFPSSAPEFDWTYALTAWVNDGVNDIKPTVDEQAQYLADWAHEAHFAWPLRASSTEFPEWATTGTAKTFLSDTMLVKATLLFPVGSTIKVSECSKDDCRYPTLMQIGASDLAGEKVVIDEVFRVDYEDGAVRIKTLPTYKWVRPWHATVIDPEAKSPEQTRIEELEQQVTELRDRLTSRINQHAEDIDTIGDRLMREAQNRDWCSEYDDVVNSLNRELNVELPLRSRDVEVTIYYDVRDTGSYTTTVTVRGDEDPEEVAREEFDNTVDSDEAWSNADGSAEVEITSVDVE